MKSIRRGLSLILALVLSAALCAPALAVNAQVSTQSVKVDGAARSVQPYNIDGNNFFKLRDVAALLNGTDASFEVSYSAKANKMYVYTGRAYTAVGGELEISKGASVTCVVSAWSLTVDGKSVACSIYKIDGNNYFKLRDLGNAIGFDVNYDEASRTVLITTKGAEAWSPDIAFSTTDANGGAWTDACFKDAKLTMINYWAYWCGPCVNELPDIQKLSASYASKGVQVLGVFDADSYSEKKNLAVIDDLALTFPCLRYVSGFDGYLQSGYMPTTIFVDGSGKVIGEAYIGSRSYDQWAGVIDGLLK